MQAHAIMFYCEICSDKSDLRLSSLEWHGCIKWYRCLSLPCDRMLPTQGKLKIYCSVIYVAHMITDISWPTAFDFLLPPTGTSRPQGRKGMFTNPARLDSGLSGCILTCRGIQKDTNAHITHTDRHRCSLHRPPKFTFSPSGHQTSHG